ncbi:hypothetical protein G3I40_33195 [Streptomyces sp. SID14478]|uniref:hypothetical protein n=1 Tax=Streptomyces sp. SID14478 TaxID=2706073 RepID=UPI0013D9CE49|nr:hypothetical protein [Streptomyces sp. SID14478]NEB80031.1 hypothetical protein [Streptomyces sp. SID14478]
MKTTTMFLNLANPRRTTLAHLKDADEIQAAPAVPDHSATLPANTANPKRTILMVAPEIVPVA